MWRCNNRCGMAILIIGLILFLGPHSLRMAAPRVRQGIVDRRGEGAVKGIVAIPSLAGIVLIVWGFATAETESLYAPPPWGSTINAILMVPALVLAIASGAPPGHIRHTVVHPLLIATILWAVGHLLSVGDSAGVILFGAFLAWSLINVVMQPRDASTATSSIRFDMIAILVGLILYALLVWRLHSWLFGAAPLSSGRDPRVHPNRYPPPDRQRYSCPQGRRADRLAHLLSCAHRCDHRPAGRLHSGW